MRGDHETKTLNYEAPVDRLHRLRFKRNQVPHTRLGIVSCFICGTSIVATSLLFLLSIGNLQDSFVGSVLGGSAGLSYVLCLAAGIPLALGGFADEGHRKRFALIGLVANVLWLLGPLVLLMLYSRKN
jgi:hypothetical protein